MRRLDVSERAETDLREIWLYSFKTWDEAQADRYLGELDAGLRECGAEPERGTCRDDVRPGYWSRLIRRHIAFYTFTENPPYSGRVPGGVFVYGVPGVYHVHDLRISTVWCTPPPSRPGSAYT